MKFPNLYLLLFFILPFAGFSQDELVDIGEITFHSELEKKVLTDHFRKAESDNFLLFMASGNLMNENSIKDAKTRYLQHLTNFTGEKFNSKKNDKKAKAVHDEIHKTFLKKFQNQSGFEDIFTQGNYDRISATALYALTFHDLKIPYSIREEPENIYLIAFPGKENIKVEAASPLAALFVINDAFKQQYVKALKDQKLISAQEFNSQDFNVLFNKYYYGNQQHISLYNLLGIQYLEDAQAKYEEKNFEAAYAQAEKAYLFYPTSKTAYILMVTGSTAFDARKQLDSVKAVQLAKLSRYKDLGIGHDIIVGEFARVVNDLLFEKGKRGEVTRFYNILYAQIRNMQLQSEIRFLYNYELGRYLYNEARYAEALSFFELAIAEKPEKQDAANAFISTLANTLTSMGSTENLKTLEEYSKKYPSLHNNNNFNNILLSSYLIQSSYSYDMENSQLGEKYRALFEDMKHKYPDVRPNANLVGQAYSRAAIYYYRKGQTAKAKTIIETGLKFSPDNYELLSRQRMIR